MKKTPFLILSSLMIISFASCKSEGDKLVGTWAISNVMSKETYEQGDKADEIYKEADQMLQGVFKGANLEFRKDKTAVLKKENENQLEYTWKMDDDTGKILELYKKGNKTGDQAEIVFWPAVKGAESLFYMKGIDSQIVAQMIFTEDNTSCIVFLSKSNKD
jgi:hypothetical protein